MRNLICGFGRCGSSLVMQMIHAAGGAVSGEYPMFETGKRKVSIADGASTKILEPLAIEIPEGEYRIVWLDRNVNEQVKSEIKFFKTLGIAPPPFDLLVDLRQKERLIALQRLSKYGKILKITFEELITERKTVERLATFLNLTDIDKMLAQIIFRSVECLPDLKIEMALAESGPKS